MAYGEKEKGGPLGKLFGDMPKSEGDEAPVSKPEPGEPEGDDELPPGFAEAGEEFLDASLPTEQRLAALKRAIHACTDSY